MTTLCQNIRETRMLQGGQEFPPVEANIQLDNVHQSIYIQTYSIDNDIETADSSFRLEVQVSQNVTRAA
jgi:hypothetical protein